MDGWKDLEGKKVYVRTNSNKVYQGVVLEVEIKDDDYFITLVDKFNKFVGINKKEIAEIKEERY